jgi:3-deoxy-D-manno-octulosonic-acid transferase
MAVGGLVPLWARKRREGWAERFGHTPDLGPPRGSASEAGVPSSGRRVLLHAVSVGEVNALRTLVPLLADRVEVVVSSTTDTGLARARALFAGRAGVVRYPLDASWCVRRFLRSVRPDAVGLVELELWPNFLSACRRLGVPAAVINGRLSERSFRGYRRLRPIVGGMFAGLRTAAVQDETYAHRFRAMGVPEVVVTGSMKWDAAALEPVTEQAHALARAMGIDRTRPLIVAGSTGPGEEELLRSACPAGVQLLCAPRKPERFDGAELALTPCVRRSRSGERPDNAARFLLDSIGELRAAYELADVVVVGRSFGDQFGSDPIEPAALGKAVVMGPRAEDFAVIVAALESAGGLVRTSRERLGDELVRLLRDSSAREELGRRARGCVLHMQGASARHAELLTALARQRRPSTRRTGPGPDSACSLETKRP